MRKNDSGQTQKITQELGEEKMTNDYFLLTKTKNGKHALSWKHNWEGMMRHKNMEGQYGDKIVGDI